MSLPAVRALVEDRCFVSKTSFDIADRRHSGQFLSVKYVTCHTHTLLSFLQRWQVLTGFATFISDPHFLTNDVLDQQAAEQVQVAKK